MSHTRDSRVCRRSYDQFPDEHSVRQVLREVWLAQRQFLDDCRRQRQHRDAQVPPAGRRQRRTLPCVTERRDGNMSAS